MAPSAPKRITVTDLACPEGMSSTNSDAPRAAYTSVVREVNGMVPTIRPACGVPEGGELRPVVVAGPEDVQDARVSARTIEADDSGRRGARFIARQTISSGSSFPAGVRLP